MLAGLADQARETLNDKDKAQHFGGKTVVSVATMLSGVGLFSKGATITDVADKTGDVASKIIDPKAGEALNKLRLADRYNPAFLKATEKYLEGADQKILGIIADKPNFDVVVREMAQQWTKYTGGRFMLKNIENRGEDFASKITKFEAKVIDEANFTADVQLSDGAFLEYKSWQKSSYRFLNGDNAKNQLRNYINNGEFEYIVDKQKLIKDGVPDPDTFAKEQFQKIFQENADEWFKLEEAGGTIDDPRILSNLFGTTDLNTIKGMIDDTSSEFYNKIIKVE